MAGRARLHGGELHVTRGPAYVGQQHSSSGTFRQYDGDVALGRELYIGNQRNTQGLWEIHDGRLDVDRNFSVGREGTGELLQIGGAVSVGSSLELAQSHADSSGRYEMQNGSLDVAGGLTVGRLGAGEFIQQQGDVTVAANVSLAQEDGDVSGRYEIHSGTLEVGTFFQVGRRGTGEFLQTGGEVYVRRQDSDPAFMVGAQGSGTGLYTMEGGELHVTRGRTVIGHRDQSNGTFLQHDGTVSLGHHLTIGNDADTKGLWEIHDGELNLSTNKDHFFYVGNAGEGRFVQTGGNVTQPARGAMYLANSGSGEGYYDISGGTLDQGSLSIGNGGGFGEFTQTGGDVVARRDIRIARAGGTGAYAISGGTLTVDNSSGDNDGVLNVGYDTSGSTGTFTQTGGIVDALGGIRLANGSGITGTYTLSGGELRVPSISKGSGSAQFDWSGGTIRPRNGGNLSVTTSLTLSGTGATFNSSDAGGTARNIAVPSHASENPAAQPRPVLGSSLVFTGVWLEWLSGLALWLVGGIGLAVRRRKRATTRRLDSSLRSHRTCRSSRRPVCSGLNKTLFASVGPNSRCLAQQVSIAGAVADSSDNETVRQAWVGTQSGWNSHPWEQIAGAESRGLAISCTQRSS